MATRQQIDEFLTFCREVDMHPEIATSCRYLRLQLEILARTNPGDLTNVLQEIKRLAGDIVIQLRATSLRLRIPEYLRICAVALQNGTALPLFAKQIQSELMKLRSTAPA